MAASTLAVMPIDLSTFEQTVRQLVPSVFTLVGALLLYQLVRRSTRLLAQHGQLSPIMALRLRVSARWVLIGTTALIVLQQVGVFGQAWAVLTAVLAAIAVGFVASWSVLSNATCALLLLFYRPFRVGDELELLEPDGRVGVSGRVIDLNLLFTTLLDSGDSVVRVPNNLFVQKYSRVRREGHAPDPARDSSTPFFTITPGTRMAYKPTLKNKRTGQVTDT
jgi:small-conductance mechanosensitive channel